MSPVLALHLCGAACALALGVMMVVATSLALGGLLTLGGGAWLIWALRRV